MRGARHLWSLAVLMAMLPALAFAPARAVDQPSSAVSPGPAAAPNLVLSLAGRVRHPQRFDVEALRKLPAESVQVSFQTERGPLTASFSGVRLWTLLGEAGGIDDPEKGAELHHLVKVTGQDGYWVVISTGEIAPDFGAEPALVAYQRDGAPLGGTGFRLVIPGDKHGGHSVRDVTIIAIE
jgi:DMSO/TMAO reductase YedYZ molybdopterin-dependent catalytic subunit